MVVPTTVDCACNAAKEQIPINSVKIFFIVLIINKIGRKIIKKNEEIGFLCCITIIEVNKTMKLLALLIATFIWSHAWSQVTDSTQLQNNPVFVEEKFPEFPGGTSNLYKFIADNIQYPKVAYENGVEGTVYVKFKVDENGFVQNPVIVRGIGAGLDEEALRVINSQPQWTPVDKNGNQEDVYFTVPVKFDINNVTKEDKKRMRNE